MLESVRRALMKEDGVDEDEGVRGRKRKAVVELD